MPEGASHEKPASCIECQMSGLYMTQCVTEMSLWTDLKITRAVKNC